MGSRVSSTKVGVAAIKHCLSDSIVGMGAAVSRTHIVTCAHVINASLGRNLYTSTPPSAELTVIFPLANSEIITSKKINVWHPLLKLKNQLDGKICDIAIIELVDVIPEDVGVTCFASDVCESYRQLTVYGFPSLSKIGSYAKAEMGGKVANDWYEIQGDGAKNFVQKGFSGAAVWCTEAKAHVGLLAAVNEGKDSEKIAHMIPVSILHKAWPQLPIAKKEIHSTTNQNINMTEKLSALSTSTNPVLLQDAMSLYQKGRISDCLKVSREAMSAGCSHDEIAGTLIKCLLRHGYSDEAKTVLKDWRSIYSSIEELERIIYFEAEVYRREYDYTKALKHLNKIQDRNAKNVAFHIGLCHLLIYGSQKLPHESSLLRAHHFLKRSYELQPNDWFVITNLSFVKRIMNQGDKQLEDTALAKLNELIARYPLKTVVKVYRLLIPIIRNDLQCLRQYISSDHKCCPKTLELGADFVDTMAERIKIRFATDPERAEIFLQELRKWASPFEILG